MSFLTNLGIPEICCFKFAIERKAGKEIIWVVKIRVLGKEFSKQLHFIRCKSGPLIRGGIGDLLLLRTLLAICQKSRQPSLWEVIDSFVLLAKLFCFISKIKFGRSKHPLAMIIIILLVQKVIFMSYPNFTNSWKSWRWMSLDLIFRIKYLHINCNLGSLTKFSSSPEAPDFKI